VFLFGVGWVTGVPLGLQNPEGGACRLWWVRFPHSPANIVYKNEMLKSVEGVKLMSKKEEIIKLTSLSTKAG